MAHLSPGQLAARRRIERLIRIAAPFLDVLLAAGDRVSRVAGRNQLDPDPPRRVGERGARTPIGGPPSDG